MKKIIAILLSALLVVSAVSLFASAESTNVLAGKTYELSGCGVKTTYYANLTDGVAAENLATEDNNANWFGFYCNGEDQSVINAPDKVGYAIFDLGGSYKLDKIRANIISNGSWGIPAPEAVKAYISDDGEAWTEAGAFSYELVDGVAVWTEITGDWTAKFLKVEFTLAGTFAFVNEIEAYGVEAAADESSEDASSEDASSEDASSEDASSEDTSSEDTSSDAPVVGGSAIEEELKELVGEANADAKFDCVIDAPETYVAGDEIVVTVTIDNITAADGLDYIKFLFNYDNTKLAITNDIDERDNGNLVCLDLSGLTGTAWENFTIVNSNFKDLTTDDLKGGVQAVADNDGVIDASALTTTLVFDSVGNGDLVFTFTFTANEDASGDIGLYIAHDTVSGGLNVDAGLEEFAGNGAYAIIADENAPSDVESSDDEPSDDESSDDESSDDTASDDTSSDDTASDDTSSDDTASDDTSSDDTASDDAASDDVSSDDASTESSGTSSQTPVKPGDASNMIIFAIVALVAIVGSAVVIKTRR